MDDLVSHSEVTTAYERWQSGEALRQSFARRTFFYAGIMFEEYRGTVGGVQFIGDDKARFFPVGTPGLFENYFGPADFMETANTIGLPRYAKQTIDPEFQRWVKLHMQSNPLPICTRPKALQRGKRT